jgi:hypothetical protein
MPDRGEAEALKALDAADDIDQRVEGADLVQRHFPRRKA